MAWLCCDARRQVRMQALTYLQRALLVHDLQTLDAVEWESCFNKVMKSRRKQSVVCRLVLNRPRVDWPDERFKFDRLMVVCDCRCCSPC